MTQIQAVLAEEEEVRIVSIILLSAVPRHRPGQQVEHTLISSGHYYLCMT